MADLEKADIVTSTSSKGSLEQQDLPPTRGGWMAKLFDAGVEARGIERVPESERVPRGVAQNTLMWFSVNAVLTTVPIGVLAQEYFSLTFPHAVATILCFTALGCVATSFISTLGPKTGLRTMVISRYAGGKVGGFIFAVLNILTQVGFSILCVVLGAQTLASINDVLPLAAGVVIISMSTLVICLFGYNVFHHWERYAWIVMFMIFVFLYGLGSKGTYDIQAQAEFEDEGRALVGDVLSFGGILFGAVVGWSPIAADFNVMLPADTSPKRVYWLTFIGLFIPITFVEILGALLMTISDPAYPAAFAEGGTGGLLAQTLSPWGGFGKFLLVVLALSTVSNNCANLYSTALSVQALCRPFQRVPRFLWTILVALIFMVAGIAGREHFSEILTNLLSILSYWVAAFVVIVAEEHFIFRREGGKLGGYDLDAWNDYSKLPPGFACVLALVTGISGAVVGMATTYYIGPIALLVAKPFGGDLGFELSAVFAGIVFPVVRAWEIRKYGR